MTRRMVQLALFASAAWMLLLVFFVVLALTVRAPLEPADLVVGWSITLTAGAVVILLGLLWMVLADTVRAAVARGEPAPTPAEILYPDEPSSGSVRVLDPEELADSIPLEEVLEQGSSGEPEILGGQPTRPSR